MMDGGALEARAEVDEGEAEAEAIGGAEEEEEEEEEEEAIVRSEEDITDREEADLDEVEVEVDSGAGGIVRSGGTALRSPADVAVAGLRWAQDTASGVPLEECVPVRYEQTVRVRSSSARGGAGPRPVSRAVPLLAPSAARSRPASSAIYMAAHAAEFALDAAGPGPLLPPPLPVGGGGFTLTSPLAASSIPFNSLRFLSQLTSQSPVTGGVNAYSGRFLLRLACHQSRL